MMCAKADPTNALSGKRGHRPGAKHTILWSHGSPFAVWREGAAVCSHSTGAASQSSLPCFASALPS